MPMPFEVTDDELATAKAAVRAMPPEALAVFLAAAIRRVADHDRPWLPISTVNPALPAYEARGLFHAEANSPGRFEATHWRPRETDTEHP